MHREEKPERDRDANSRRASSSAGQVLAFHKVSGDVTALRAADRGNRAATDYLRWAVIRGLAYRSRVLSEHGLGDSGSKDQLDLRQIGGDRRWSVARDSEYLTSASSPHVIVGDGDEADTRRGDQRESILIRQSRRSLRFRSNSYDCGGRKQVTAPTRVSQRTPAS